MNYLTYLAKIVAERWQIIVVVVAGAAAVALLALAIWRFVPWRRVGNATARELGHLWSIATDILRRLRCLNYRRAIRPVRRAIAWGARAACAQTRKLVRRSRRQVGGVSVVPFRLGWALFVLLAVVGMSLLLQSFSWGAAVLGLDLVYLGTCLHEIRSPNYGLMYTLGKFKGVLEPGWYLIIPHIWNVEILPTEWQTVDVEGGMYVKGNTPIKVKAKIFYRADEEKAEEILRMRPSEMKERAKAVGAAHLRGEIGSNTFTDLVAEKDKIEASLTQRLKDEFERYGYEVRDAEIEDFDELVVSEAEKIRQLGKARGEAAKAIADAVKDNYPAAIVSSVQTLADAAAKVAATRPGLKKEAGEGSIKKGAAKASDTDLADRLKRALDALGV